jgi:predicted MPP superfamily phosphohydrolase
MPDESFSWLHLTDLHYGLSSQDCLWPNLRPPFLESLEDLRDRCGPWDAVFFTGDLTQRGTKAEFDTMQEQFLDPLRQRLEELDSGNATFLAVPGNHDLKRPDPNSNDPAVDALLVKGRFKEIADKFWSGKGYQRVIVDAFQEYDRWWSDAPGRPDTASGLLPGDFSITLTVRGHKVGIVGLNTAFLQLEALIQT